jgi:hypothetical protein
VFLAVCSAVRCVIRGSWAFELLNHAGWNQRYPTREGENEEEEALEEALL